jgi:hypothetical protein
MKAYIGNGEEAKVKKAGGERGNCDGKQKRHTSVTGLWVASRKIPSKKEHTHRE